VKDDRPGDIRGKRQPVHRRGSNGSSAKIGAVLLELQNALQRAERCRRTLKRLGFSQRRWLEIVHDVNPDLRFAVRSKMLDAIVAYLERAAAPVSRDILVHDLLAQGAGALHRIRQSVTANLRRGNLVLCPEDKIGLPEWREKVPSYRK
jgi:hypothetical protein